MSIGAAWLICSFRSFAGIQYHNPRCAVVAFPIRCALIDLVGVYLFEISFEKCVDCFRALCISG